MNDYGASTRKRIRGALQNAIETTGADSGKLTVSRLLRVADISRTTFYAYYENMADALEDLALDVGEQIIEVLRRENRKTPGLNGYISGYQNILRFVFDHKKLFDVLLESRFFDQVFVSSVIEYLYESYLVEYPNEDREILRYSAIGSTNYVYGMIKEWQKNGYDKSAEEMGIILQGALRLSLKVFQPKA